MKRSVLIAGFVVASVVAGCAGPTPPPSTAVMPPAALQTNGDVDVRAMNIAAYGFSHYRELQRNPALAAETIATLDYLGGQLNSSPRWVTIPALFRMQMLSGRNQVRGILGISEATPSQDVVDTMIALAAAYRAGDQAAVDKLFASPIFSLPPAETEQRLATLPYLPSVNNAAQHVAALALGYQFTGG